MSNTRHAARRGDAHAIETLTWESVIRDDRDAAYAHQARLSAFLNGPGLVTVSRVFSQMSVPGEVWRLDRLELDTGPLRPDDSFLQWADILEGQLVDALLRARHPHWGDTRQLAREPRNEGHAAPERRAEEGARSHPRDSARDTPRHWVKDTSPESARRFSSAPAHEPPLESGRDTSRDNRRPSDYQSLEHFLFYLQRGHLPWSRSTIAGRKLSSWLATLARRTGPRLWSLLRDLRPASYVLARLSQITPYQGLQALIGVRHRSLANSLDALDAQLLVPSQAGGRLSAYQVQQIQQAWRVAAFRTLWDQHGAHLSADDVQRLQRELGNALARQLGRGAGRAWRPRRGRPEHEARPQSSDSARGDDHDSSLTSHLLTGVIAVVWPTELDVARASETARLQTDDATETPGAAPEAHPRTGLPPKGAPARGVPLETGRRPLDVMPAGRGPRDAATADRRLPEAAPAGRPFGTETAGTRPLDAVAAGRSPLDAALRRLTTALDRGAPLDATPLELLLQDLQRRAPGALRTHLRAHVLQHGQAGHWLTDHGGTVTTHVLQAITPPRSGAPAVRHDAHWVESLRQFSLAALSRGAGGAPKTRGGSVSALQAWLADFSLHQLASGERPPQSQQGWHRLWQQALLHWQQGGVPTRALCTQRMVAPRRASLERIAPALSTTAAGVSPGASASMDAANGAGMETASNEGRGIAPGASADVGGNPSADIGADAGRAASVAIGAGAGVAPDAGISTRADNAASTGIGEGAGHVKRAGDAAGGSIRARADSAASTGIGEGTGHAKRAGDAAGASIRERADSAASTGIGEGTGHAKRESNGADNGAGMGTATSRVGVGNALIQRLRLHPRRRAASKPAPAHPMRDTVSQAAGDPTRNAAPAAPNRHLADATNIHKRRPTPTAIPSRWHALHRVESRAERLVHILALPSRAAPTRDWLTRRHIAHWLAAPSLCADWLAATRPSQRWALLATLFPRQVTALRRTSTALYATRAALTPMQSPSAREAAHWRFFIERIITASKPPTTASLVREQILRIGADQGHQGPMLNRWLATATRVIARKSGGLTDSHRPGRNASHQSVDPIAPSLPAAAGLESPAPSNTSRQRPANWLQSILRRLDRQPTPVERAMATKPDIHRASHTRPAPDTATVNDIELPDPSNLDHLDNGETFYVGDAGMVLLAVYTQRLFDRLTLLETGEFRDPEAISRAVRCLTWLTHGQDVSEPECLLAKLLCGMPLRTPLSGDPTLDDDTHQLLDSLLGAVIANWKAIGNTSAQGLRQTFLQREGRLTHETGEAGTRWRLVVRPGQFDMLLDRLPWSFSTIKLPWMKEVLHVDWR